MYQGNGDPSTLDGVPWRDVEAWLMLTPIFEARQSLGGLPEE